MNRRQDNRYFEDVINAIKDAEIDIDKVLEAARLDRKERESRKLTSEQKAEVLCSIMAVLTVATVLGFLLALIAMLK